MNKTIPILFIFLLSSCNFEQNNTEITSEILLVDSLDKPFKRLTLHDSKLHKAESLDSRGEVYGIQVFENDTIISEKFWNKEGHTTHQYSNEVMMTRIQLGAHYAEYNYSSVLKFEQKKIREQIQFYRPREFRYDSSEMVDLKNKTLVFKNFDLNYKEPIRSRIIHYSNNIAISEDTVDGKYILRYRDKLIKTPYNNGEHP